MLLLVNVPKCVLSLHHCLCMFCLYWWQRGWLFGSMSFYRRTKTSATWSFFWPVTKTDEWYLTVLPSPIMCYHGVNLLNIRGGRWVLLLRFLSCPLDAEVQSRGAHFKVPNIFEEHPPEECTCFGLTTERSTKEVRTASHGLWGVGQASIWETRQFTNLEHLWSESLDSH